MRETFEHLWELIGAYRFIKLGLEGKKTILPSKDFNPRQDMNAWAMRSSREEKLCFVGDVENFVRHYEAIQPGHFRIPTDCLLLIFLQRFCPDASKYKTYGTLAFHFGARIERGERIPKRLRHKANLHNIGDAMWEKMEAYYASKGMLPPVVEAPALPEEPARNITGFRKARHKRIDKTALMGVESLV